MDKVQEKADTKKCLLRSAIKLFTDKGYKAVSTRELAEDAEVNLGAIQYHFGSKAKLFIETVHELMRERFKNLLLPKTLPRHRQEAAEKIYIFIRSHLTDNCNPEGPDICRMMCREINSSTADDPELCEPLIASVVENFTRPNADYLRGLVTVILPEASQEKVTYTAQSIVAQCLFYANHRLILSHLHDHDQADTEHLPATIRSVAEFSLRALGFGEDEIPGIIENAEATFEEVRKK